MNTSKSLDEIQEMLEDWLDNASHSGKLPSKINFSDIQKIAEYLAPELKAWHRGAIVEAVEGLIGEDEPYIPPKNTPDHWGLTTESISRQLENGKRIGKNELRAELRQAIKEWQ